MSGEGRQLYRTKPPDRSIGARKRRTHATIHAHSNPIGSREANEPDRTRFAEFAEGELLGLHEGNFTRFRLRPYEFDAWRGLQDEDQARGPGVHGISAEQARARDVGDSIRGGASYSLAPACGL